jgi:hypothetical protein
MTLTYSQIYQGTFTITDNVTGNTVTPTLQPVVSVIYYKNGSALDAKTGPLELGIMTASNEVSEASAWIKQVIQIEIINP